MFPGWIKAELIIEGDHAINIYFRYIKKSGNLNHGFPGKIAKFALNLLQDGYEITLFSTELV